MRIGLIILASTLFVGGADAQVDDFCREFGLRPTLDDLESKIPYIYGRVTLKGHDPSAKFPLITVNFLDARQTQRRLTIERSGNYCFRRNTSGGGTLIVEVEGVESARKQISSIGAAHTREDFEVYLIQGQQQQIGRPGVVSAKYSRPRNDKTVELYQKAAEAEAAGLTNAAIAAVKEIVAIDREDFVAWSKLGSLYFAQNALKDAEKTFRRALEIRGDYTPALINLGTVAAVQNYHLAAIALFQEAIKTDPTWARAYRLLGEAYLQNKQGSLGLTALDKALELDPQGMAECHLLKARLYDLAGHRKLAAAEYKAFLKKVREHPEKATFEKYVKENPE